MELQKVVGNVYEELVSAGSVKSPDDKKNVAMMIKQLQDHYVDTLNSAYGDRFVFSGYNTPGDFATGRETVIKPFTIVNVPSPVDGFMEPRLHFNGFDISQFDGMSTADYNAVPPPVLAPPAPSVEDFEQLRSLLGDVLTLDVGPGVSMPVTMNGIDIVFYTTMSEDGTPIMRNTFDVLQEVYLAVNGDDARGIPPLGTDELTKKIKTVQDAQNHLLTRTAELGGRSRRLELLEARYEQDFINYEQMRSDAEDADMAEVIMYLKMAETVYQASLSAGARIIQPTLMDFLR